MSQSRLQAISRHLSTESVSAAGRGLLSGQVAIITGSGQGIGAAAAKLFAHEGAKVVVSDLDATKAEAIANEIRAAGGEAISVAGDVTDPTFPEKVVGGAIKAFGKVNILVNNAGYTWDGVVHRMTDKQWYAMMDCHVTAPFRLIKELGPHFRKPSDEPRCIVNISSVSGTHGNAGQANYSSAKSAIIGLTKTIAKEWGSFGVRCNAIAFGLIDTRLTRTKQGEAMDVGGTKVQLGLPEGLREMATTLIPLQRPGTADEAAGSILMLCCPHAAYITGQILEVTGGANM